MKTIIISAFPACGKTWLFDNQSKFNKVIADSDSSKFSWVYTSKGKIRNPDFPNNYIKHIKSLIGTVDYILVSSHQEVREALEDNALNYVLVLPGTELKNEWIGRCYLRNSPPEFLNLLANNWDNWTNVSEIRLNGNMAGISLLSSNKYLVDVLNFIDTFSGV